MSDEELLKAAEGSYSANVGQDDIEAHQANSLRSISASLLVIARHSIPVAVPQPSSEPNQRHR